MQFIAYILLGISAMTFTLAAPMEANVDRKDKGDIFLPIFLPRPQVVQPSVPNVSGNTNNQGAINSGSGLAAGGSGAGNIGGSGGGATAGPASAFNSAINRFGNVG